MRPLLATAVALCSLSVLTAPALAEPTITEFSAGITAGSEPRDIAAASDGTLWFTENALIGRLGRITTSGTVTEFSAGLTVGGGPWSIAPASDGNMWFTENALLGSVGRTTLLGGVTQFTSGLTTGGQLRHIAEGPDGNLWATWSANPGRIVRITPSGTITEFTAGLLNNNSPWGITAGPDGNIWFTERANPARIGRVTPSGVITEFRDDDVLPATAAPEEIVAGPDGNLWFTVVDGIGRITPAGVMTMFRSGITPGSRPTGLAAGPGRIGRITTDGVVTEFQAGLTAGSEPLGITAGPDGNMWFAQRLTGTIGRITTYPAVTSGVATATGDTTATVAAAITPNSQDAEFRVEYGPTTAYGSTSAPVAATASLTPAIVSATLSGLTPGATHHYRTVATNASGTTYGPDRTVTTPATPATPDAEPTPTVGRRVVAETVAGVIRVRRPGTSTFTTLDDSTPVPVGSVIDSTRGRIEVVSALPGGDTQSATFWGGVFQVRQTVSAGGMVDIHLRGPAPVCATVMRAASHDENAVRRPVGRTLWGKDSKGKYRTHGRNSVATVRGTQWMTRETCAGTLTRVAEGAVSVRDVARKKTVLVRKGGSYLARARR